MTTDSIKEWIAAGRKYADAIDKDRGLESGLTDCLRGLSDALETIAGEVERLTTNGIHTCHDNCPRLPCVQGREIRAITAERDRLKAALVTIAETIDGFEGRGDYVSYVSFSLDIADIARKALGDAS